MNLKIIKLKKKKASGQLQYRKRKQIKNLETCQNSNYDFIDIMKNMQIK